MNMDSIANRRQAMIQRIQTLYQSGGAEPERQHVLSRAFEELQVALEVLQAVEEAMHAKQEEILSSVDSVESERRRYQELFDLAPLGYLVTSLEGTIRQANLATATLLGCEARQLVGRSLALFVPEGERRPFHSTVAELRGMKRHEWEFRLQPWNGTPLTIAATVAPLRDRVGRATGLLWLLHDRSEHQQRAQQLLNRSVELESRIGELEAALKATHYSLEIPAAPEAYAQTLRQKFALLAEASVLLAVALDANAALVQVAHLTTPLIADLCLVDSAGTDGELCRLVVAYKEPSYESLARKLQTCPPDTLTGQELCSGQPTRCARIPGASRLGAVRTPDTVLVVPWWVRGQVLGVLTFVLMQSGRSFGPGDLAFAEELARRAAVACDRACRYHEA